MAWANAGRPDCVGYGPPTEIVVTRRNDCIMSELPTIPLTDIREGGPVRHAIEARTRMRALRDDCMSWLMPPVRVLLPAMDAVTRLWLRRSCSPYVAEIGAIAAAVGLPGLWFFNGTYAWGCTTVAREEGGAPWLARTLDWPFPGLGRHLEIMRMRGPAGDFFNVGWPGYVGALTASAPGRFAAAINQAPLRRRTVSPLLRPYDLAANALSTWQLSFCPPDHLLRHVFETCRNFAQAKDRLETVPIARPVIFTLVGCAPGERCVIERTEQGFVTRVDDTVAANDWLQPAKPWEARVAARLLFTASYEEAAARSRARREALGSWSRGFTCADFAWVAPPVLNPFTRCAVQACPARGRLSVVGYEIEDGRDLPLPVTKVRDMTVGADPIGIPA